jgi:DNA-binding NtrC family response regulator
MSKILIVDEEGEVLGALEGLLTASCQEVACVPRGDMALDRLQREPFDLVILDLSMPGIDGLESLREIKRHRPKMPVIIVTGQGTMETAIEATRRGAFDYQLKPFDPEEMLRIIQRALKGAEMMKGRVVVGPKHVGCHGDAIVGRSRGMQEVFKAIGRVAATDVTVLICGESGTGKELIARAIHEHSLRDGRPLLTVNCAAIPETLLEGELFGYERGAFTGAVARRIGKFEQADKGTIFLDEIGDAPLSIQAKILRILQERTFERLGGNETLRSDVRTLAATNQDLERAIREGSFRADLYHRLNVVFLQVPPLRERPEDIPLLIDYFLARFSEELNVEKPLLADDALQLLREYSWPGNVRELQHRIRRAVLFTRGYPIQASDFPLKNGVHRPGFHALPAALGDDAPLGLVREHLDRYSGPRAHEELVERIEQALLTESLRRAHGNQTQAAKLLGLARATFLTKLQKHGLHSEPRGPT